VCCSCYSQQQKISMMNGGDIHRYVGSFVFHVYGKFNGITFDGRMILVRSLFNVLYRPCHSSGDWSPASLSGCPGSSSGQVMWDL
jgi:hypothetical protein